MYTVYQQSVPGAKEGVREGGKSGERKTERERKDGYESERTVEKWGRKLMKWKQEK